MVEPLRRLLASIDTWEACLNAGTCSAGDFLTAIEAALLDILDAPELAALRDWVRDRFRAARAQAQVAEVKARGLQLVALDRPGAGPQSSAKAAGNARETVGITLEMARQRKLQVDLCVTSVPVGADFRMWPASEPNRQTAETTTDRWLHQLYRGNFAYSLRKDDLNLTYECSGSCPRLNLVDYPQPTFHCDLRARTCTREDSLPSACPRR
jgi:hypothetical protein